MVPNNNSISRNSRWADECEGEKGIYHDSNRKTSTFEYVGQNYASKYHSTSLGDKFLNEMIQLLYDEVKNWKSLTISSSIISY